MVQKKRKQYKVSVGFRAVLLAMALVITFFSISQVTARIEVPSNDDIFFQTTGRNADLGIGDFYTNVRGDDIHHSVEINIPCIPDKIFKVQLFDPEVYDAGLPGQTPPVEAVDDESRDEGDMTSFRLRDPTDTEIAFATYGPFPQPPAPPPPSHDVWNEFAVITLPPNPIKGDTCGIFTIDTWTGDESNDPNNNDPNANNDDNAWKYRILGGPVVPGDIDASTFDPAIGSDNRPGTGDEAALGIQRLSFQHNNSQSQTFYWFVDDALSPTWTGHNFDIDDGTGLCPTADSCEIIYNSPSGATFPATTSGNEVWNPNSITQAGDEFTNTEPGLWSADVTIPVDNQYIIEIENSGKPIFLTEPILPELTITKDDGVTFVTSPGVTTYTLVIENIGEGAALPIVGSPEVFDTLPPGMTFGGCMVNAPLTGSCDESAPGSGVINFELEGQDPALNSDGSEFEPILAYLPGTTSGLISQGTLTVIANIDPGLPDDTVFTNTATVDWTDIYDNNYVPVSDVDVDLLTSLDLQISKRHEPPIVEAGDNLTYTIVISNVGGVIATGVVITDQIPANTTFVSASDGGSFAGGIITWLIPSFDIGQVASRQVVVRVDDPLPSGVNTVVNTATVGDDGSSGPDRNTSDNQATDTTPITSSLLDLQISKRHEPPIVEAGDNLTYTIVISNVGDVMATGVVITDQIPVNTTFVSASDSGSFDNVNEIITWLIPSFDIGQTASRQVVVRVDDPLPPGVNTVINTATVGDDGTNGSDRNTSDNQATDTTPISNSVIAIVDPIITKRVDVSEVIPGDSVNYSITISNPAANSNTSATGVFLTDVMPREMDLVNYSVTANPASLFISSTTVTTDLVSVVGHSSGITQTVVSTITVAIPVLGIDEEVTLSIQAQANALAGPPPLNVTNQAFLDFNEGNQKQDQTTVTVRDIGTSPTPTPTRPSSGGGDNDDDDDDDDGDSSDDGSSNNNSGNSNNGGSSSGPSSPPASGEPAPVLPVLLLPETGLQENQDLEIWPLIALLGIMSLAGFFLWRTLWRSESPE